MGSVEMSYNGQCEGRNISTCWAAGQVEIVIDSVSWNSPNYVFVFENTSVVA